MAFGALGGRMPDGELLCAEMLLDANDVWNHLAGLLNDKHIAHPHILAGHLLSVVEARPPHD